jgi:hypothetical protein
VGVCLSVVGVDGGAEGRVRVCVRVGGVEFVVECEVERLEEVVGRLLSVVVERLKSEGLLSGEALSGGVGGAVVGVARAETCRGVIMRLWEEGFFAVARGLGEVHSEMARRGFHYDRTAVAHALIDLVKDGVLSRDGKPRRYVYAQKRPPPVSVQKQVQDASKGAAVVVKPKEDAKK